MMGTMWWNRRRPERSGDATASTLTDRRIHATRPDEGELEARLAAVSAPLSTPPTADELRAAFGARAAAARDAAARAAAPVADEATAEEPADTRTFAERFPVDSLFVPTGADPDVWDWVPPEPEPEPEAPIEPHLEDGAFWYDPAEAFVVLGVDPAAPWSDIVAAHRRLAMRHHPDRLQDRPTEEREASRALMREVNVAYTILKRLRGR